MKQEISEFEIGELVEVHNSFFGSYSFGIILSGKIYETPTRIWHEVYIQDKERVQFLSVSDHLRKIS